MSSISEAEDEPIKIITNNWASQLVVSHILGGIYKSQGLKVKYVSYPGDGQWFILKHNIAHIQVEAWQGTHAEKYQQLFSQEMVVDAGTYDVITREDWWYPDYVEELCPGLPDWRALNRCSALFSQKDNSNKGVYYAGPVEWEKPEKAKVRALGLNFKIINTYTAKELWGKLDRAYKNKQPIVLFNWTPNWVGSIYKGKFVEFPEYHKKCETHPGWGINQDFLHDCGSPKSGWLKKVSSTEFPKKWPCAFEILENMNFNNNELEQIAALVDIKNLTPFNAANVWLKDNQTKWQNWLPNQCR